MLGKLFQLLFKWSQHQGCLCYCALGSGPRYQISMLVACVNQQKSKNLMPIIACIKLVILSLWVFKIVQSAKYVTEIIYLWPLPTVPWDSYMSINYHSSVEEADEIPDYPHASNELLQDLFCSKAGRAHICDVPVFVQVALSQHSSQQLL